MTIKDVKHVLLLALSVCAMLGREGVFRDYVPVPQLADFLPLAQALAVIIVDESAVGDIVDLQLVDAGAVDDIVEYRRKRQSLKSKGHYAKDSVKETEEEALLQDMSQWRARLLEEAKRGVLDALCMALELCFLSDMPTESSPQFNAAFNPMKMFTAAKASAACTTPVITHKVVKTKGSAGAARKKTARKVMPVGVLGRTLHAILAAKAPVAVATALSDARSNRARSWTMGDAAGAMATGGHDGHVADIVGLAHVENPLFSIARAGLGILTQGLGSWGFGGATTTPRPPHPSDHADLIIFVVGGVSALEVQQLQDQLDSAWGAATAEELHDEVLMRVFVGSTGILGPDDVFYQAYVRMRGR